MSALSDLAERYPDYENRPAFTEGPVPFYILVNDHKVHRPTTYGFGGEIDPDVSHQFDTRLLLPPAVADASDFVEFRIYGNSTYSDRYDSSDVSVECRLSGETLYELYRDYEYEKRPASETRTIATDAEYETIVAFVQDKCGYSDCSVDLLRTAVEKMRGKFSY